MHWSSPVPRRCDTTMISNTEHFRVSLGCAYVSIATRAPARASYVLLYPGVTRGKDMIPYFERAGVKYLDYSSLIEWPHPEFTLADGAHPTAQGHRIVAAQLVKDLGIFDGD